jgi:hypothetical protein
LAKQKKVTALSGVSPDANQPTGAKKGEANWNLTPIA